MIELMLKSDLDNLVYSTTKNKLLNPLIASISRKTIHTFMESEAHQDMLEANRRGKSGDMLREALNRGFTTTYLDEALTSLKRVVTAIQRWSVIKWAIMSSLIIYLLMPIYTAFNHHWQQDTKKIYMTPFSRWGTQQELWDSLQSVAHYCGLFIIIMSLIISTTGYIWRRNWIKVRLDKHLASWSIDKGILRS
ncbi:hypothetical protein EA142_26865, partial [Citrobacter freundii]